MDGRMVMRGQSRIAEEIALAEASAWLARLQSTVRTPAAEAGFKTWLAADPTHARAFARVTDTWDIIPGAALLSRASVSARPRSKRMPIAIAACAALLAMVVGLASWLPRDPVYRTAVGEQQTITLADGTRITLNTDSRLVVSYDAAQRRVRLTHGEALFEVAKRPQWPFVVQAGDEQVKALGTTFVVRRDPDRLAVSLIEGRVEVTRHAAMLVPGPVDPLVLSPGERVTLHADGAVRTLDRPRVEAMTAWRRGEVMFDDVALADAVAELNRYGGTRVHVRDPALQQLRVSGVFSTRDPAEFARAIAQLHHLHIDGSGADVTIMR
jgi:transmembrane sensor